MEKNSQGHLRRTVFFFLIWMIIKTAGWYDYMTVFVETPTRFNDLNLALFQGVGRLERYLTSVLYYPKQMFVFSSVFVDSN